jgi:hypothetical protein
VIKHLNLNKASGLDNLPPDRRRRRRRRRRIRRRRKLWRR